MPLARSARFERELGLTADMATVLTDERGLADYFEAVLAKAPGLEASMAANWVTVDLRALLNDSGIPIENSPVAPDSLAQLLVMLRTEVIGGRAAKHVLEEMFRTGQDAATIVETENLTQIRSDDAIDALVDDVLRSNPGVVDSYHSGKTKAFEVLVGNVMKVSRGKANVKRVREMLESKLRTMA